MLVRPAWLACAALLVPATVWSQVVRVADLNTRQIAALDRARTVVILQGGMLEEHGPYLPAFTDGILSERLTESLARGLATAQTGWTVLVFPPVSVGASGSNEIGGRFVFPGTYAVRPSTLRALFMDLATELGEQGFRWVFVVHVHGSPLHIEAIDAAGDFFHATYGGVMVNLWGLVPVLAGWGRALSTAADTVRREDGLSLHGGVDETSMLLHLAPRLVAADFRSAPTITASDYDAAFALARRDGWPGYLGAPRLATAELGERIWASFSAAALQTALEILNGRDPSGYQRYVPLLERNALYRGWITNARARDSALGERQQAWLLARRRVAPSN